MQAIITSLGAEEKVIIATDINKLTELGKSGIKYLIDGWKDFSKLTESSLMKDALTNGDLETCLELFNDLTLKYNKPFYMRLAPVMLLQDA